jgi:putative membrane protein
MSIGRLLLGLLGGALGGFVATGPMTGFMLVAKKLLPPEEQYSLPPREITERIAEQTGVADRTGEPEITVATLVNHFGYGAAAGVPYGLLASILPLPALISGMIYGCLIWAGSYLGPLPSLGVLKPATEHPPRRNLLIFAAHLIWGGTLALVARPIALK